MRFRQSILWFILILVGSTGLVHAVDDPVQAKGDRIWGDTKKKLTYMEGNVRIVQGSTVIITAWTRVDLDKKVAIFDKKVKLFHPDVTIQADNLEYNFKKKQGTFYNKVILNRTEVKDSKGRVTKDAFKLTAEELYFESDTNNFLVKNQGLVEHKDFSGTADNIGYNDKKQELLFKGNADIKRPGGEEITADEVIINTQTNSFIVKNNIKLVNEDVTITGERLDYDYKQKHGTFSDQVILNRAETKNAKGKVIKDHFQLTTTSLLFESETKNFLTQSQGTVEHKDFTGSADQIEYNDKLQQLKFEHNAHLTRPKGEAINGNLITIYIKDKNLVVTQNVMIDFKVESEADNLPKSNKKRK